jgi:uncharacterized membrane protein YbhN (UPF0104 family)/membrane-associated phospholipid phosphatase/tRNA A-37 threonylcarbamoyl transferase component Bud32
LATKNGSESFDRNPSDVIRLVLGVAIFLACVVVARRSIPLPMEIDVFRLINHLPEEAAGLFVVIMQAGAFGAIVAFSALALGIGRRRMALDLALSGTLAWLLAKGLKEVIARDRPDVLIGNVLIRGAEATGLGFPSGHAAVVSALATAAGPYLSQRARRGMWVAVWVVALARVYVGSHFPIDVIGGVALGWAVGSAVHLALGTPSRKPSAETIREALEAAGLPTAKVYTPDVDARGSAPFFADTEEGDDLFVKVVGQEQRNADWLFKSMRYLLYRELEDETPFITAKRQIQYEAYMALLAERAGVRTPPIVVATTLSDGSGLLAQRKVRGRGLNALAADDVENLPLRGIWEQVALLRRAHLAHRDLRQANVLVDDHGEPWLIDFGFGEAAASERRLNQDIAEMLASLTCLAGPRRPVETAVDVLGREAVVGAASLLQPLALSTATRTDLKARPGLLEELRQQVAELTGVTLAPVAQLTRVSKRAVLLLIGAAMAIYLALPLLGGLRQFWNALRSMQWEWVGAATFWTALRYVMASVAVWAALGRRLALGRTILVQLAASAFNRLTQKEVGDEGLSERYLERAGVKGEDARAAVTRTHAAGVLVHLAGLVAVILSLALRGVEGLEFPERAPLLIIFLVGMALAGMALLLRSPHRQQSMAAVGSTARRELREVLRDPWRAVQLFIGVAGVTAANVLALAATAQALGVALPLVQVAGIYLAGALLAAPSPTPGNLGGIEVALVLGLAVFGVPAGPAVAVVLTYRVLTFWLPILLGYLALRRLERQQVV